MQWRSTGYLFASSIPPVLAIAFLFLFATGAFKLAWLCALGIILCAEARVQVGERLPRKGIFWLHLSSAVPFFFALSVLAFWIELSWLVWFTAVTGAVAFCTGGVLWYRGIKTRMLHLQQ